MALKIEDGLGCGTVLLLLLYLFFLSIWREMLMNWTGWQDTDIAYWFIFAPGAVVILLLQVAGCTIVSWLYEKYN